MHQLTACCAPCAGGISDVQVQAVQLACARHETFLPTGQRAGFYLGDGPGVGKGRQIAAIVTENILRKRGRERVLPNSLIATSAMTALMLDKQSTS